MVGRRRRIGLVAGILMLLQALTVAICLDTSGTASFKGVIRLERRIPRNKEVGLRHLRERDKVRHERMLLYSSSYSSYSPTPATSSSTTSMSQVGVVDFPVQGTFDPFLVGLYYTRLQLGSPPRDYYVQIDTGSDVLWVSCASCNGCPVTSGLQIPLNLFDPGSSSTVSLITCSDKRCSLVVQSSDSTCSISNNRCRYTFQYGDGSGTSGFYVSDLLHFEMILGGSVVSNSSASIVFGCSTVQSGDLTKSDRAVDGIFGFGQQDTSVISQLASQGVTPRVFSHCLKGDDAGGGILVFGEIVEPNIVYSPLVPSQPHYNLNLESISVNGQNLGIDPTAFATSSSQGTIVDSGTTLAYLAEAAYDPFVSAITTFVSQTAQPVLSKGTQCYLISSSVADEFPQVSLNFAGGASMILNPKDYLIQQNSVGNAAVWCIGFQKIQGDGITILGDLVLKDKIIVYDIANQRIGWTNYDCSLSVNVSATTSSGRTEYVNAGELSNSSSQKNVPYNMIRTTMMAFLAQIYVLGNKIFLQHTGK